MVDNWHRTLFIRQWLVSWFHAQGKKGGLCQHQSVFWTGAIHCSLLDIIVVYRTKRNVLESYFSHLFMFSFHSRIFVFK